MQKNYMTYRVAALLSLGISVALYLFFILNLYFRDLVASASGGGTIPTRLLIAMSLFNLGTIFLLLFLLFILNFRILKSDLPQKRKTTGVILGSILFTVIYSIIASSIQMELIPPRPGPMPPPLKWIGVIRDMFLAVIVVFISLILYLTQKRQQVELKNEALEAENIRTRYEALKSQVNPHFLFNTLSTLDSMVESDPVRSREYIQKFSSIFRYTLKSKDVVTLREELDFVRDYSDLMQIRHGTNLEIRQDTDEGFENYLVVPMAIQGLVENAIKHNVLSGEQPLVITIRTDAAGLLAVSNPYQPREYPEKGEGVGLANLAERYRLKWHEEISIENSGGVFRVSVPLIPPSPLE